MKKKRLIILSAILFFILILVLVSGPILEAIGIEVYCISNEGGRLRFERCSGNISLTKDKAPPVISTDAQPILIDTDMAVDDWMAILYLLQLSDVDVRAITVTGAGEAHCEPGVQNALDLIALAGQPNIPVTCGRETPIEGTRVFPPSWRKNVDALSGVSIPASSYQPVAQSAVELIANTIQDSDGDLEIIALGPLTNLAEVFLTDPSLAEDIKQIYIMGGAFSVPGNVTDAPEMDIKNTTAEWNIYVDPHAAALVVASGAPITFVPLDACNYAKLDEPFYNRLQTDRNTPEAEFIYQVLTENIGFVRSGNYYFWDPLTAAIVVDESLGTFEIQSAFVVEGEGQESGATRLGEDGSPIRITTQVDGERFKQSFLDVLNGRVVD